MLKLIWASIFLFAALLDKPAQAQETRSLSGTLTLDVTPSEIDRDIQISVRNHVIVFQPPFSILRPITSRASTVVKLAAGSSQVSYSIDNIIANPVNHSIELRCLACENDFPTQFYTPNGNVFALQSSSYIDPQDLPNSLTLTAITGATISGEIRLDKIADRDLQFSLSVFSAQNLRRIFETLEPITLPFGTDSIPYSITGIDRAIGTDQYRVKLRCTNCAGASARTQTFSTSLSPNQNHSGINFLATDLIVPPITPTLLLLLE